jgi:hypothetical protein
MDFNQRIAYRTLLALQAAKNRSMSFQSLQQLIELNLEAIDSSFSADIKNVLEKLLSKIDDHLQNQYAATLNTPFEGTLDQTVDANELFDLEIKRLQEYVGLEQNDEN